MQTLLFNLEEFSLCESGDESENWCDKWVDRYARHIDIRADMVAESSCVILCQMFRRFDHVNKLDFLSHTTALQRQQLFEDLTSLELPGAFSLLEEPVKYQLLMDVDEGRRHEILLLLTSENRRNTLKGLEIFQNLEKGRERWRWVMTESIPEALLLTVQGCLLCQEGYKEEEDIILKDCGQHTTHSSCKDGNFLIAAITPCPRCSKVAASLTLPKTAA